MIVQNLLKLLYFTVVLDISQCSQATPTILVTDMNTCFRDLMFDPEIIQKCVEIQYACSVKFGTGGPPGQQGGSGGRRLV